MPFGNSASVHAPSAYELSFGDMPEDTVYAGGVETYNYKANDKRETLLKKQSEKIQKDRMTSTDEYTAGTLYSSTSGSLNVLIPIYVDTAIVDLVRKETPLYEMLPKRATRGKTYDWNDLSTLNSAAFKLEGAAQAVSDDTYGRHSTPIKFAYAVGKVTGPAIATMSGYIDILREQVMTHTRALAYLLEETILTGDASTNPEEFSGFDTLITTNTTNKSGAALTIDDLRNSIRYARQGGKTTIVGGGNPNLIVTNLATIDEIKALLQAWLNYPAPLTSLAWGIQTIEFEGIPIIASKFASITSSAKRLYVLDTSKIFLAVLQDMTYEDMAKVDDANKFMIKWYGALVMTAESHCAMIYGIL